VARAGSTCRVLVGSANLTSGLVTNIEVRVLLDGHTDEPELTTAWNVGRRLWDHEAARAWQPLAAEQSDELFAPDLLRELQATVAADPVVLTLSGTKPNRVVDVTPSGIWVETEASLHKGRPAQEIPAWMFQLAWDYLRQHGSLTNRYLLADDGLNVKRSSAVVAVLARLPQVEIVSRRPITLAWRG
jgi:plasmid replication initiation protein